MEKKLHAVLSVRLFTDRKSFGPGIAQLLRRVDEHHSLRAAAQSMEMAYSKAWTITKNAEEGLGVKLLTSTTGGKGGGGAQLTPQARQFLEAYENYCGKLRDYGSRLLDEEFSFYHGWEQDG
jgi:molybdate transport repressor ModE-like protein